MRRVDAPTCPGVIHGCLSMRRKRITHMCQTQVQWGVPACHKLGTFFLRMKVPALALQFMAQRLPHDQWISFFEPHVLRPASYHAFFLPFTTLVVVTINVKKSTHTNKVQKTGNTGILRPLLLNKHNNARAKVNSKKELWVVSFSVQ